MLPCSFYFRVAKALGNASFVDVAEKIKHIRSVKSEFELGLVREAARILEAGFSSVPDCVKEGMTEVDLICRLESAMRSMGHQGCAALSQIQQRCATGPCHVRPGGCLPQLPGFAYRWKGNLSRLSPGCRLQKDKEERADICGLCGHLQRIYRRRHPNIQSRQAGGTAGGRLSMPPARSRRP